MQINEALDKIIDWTKNQRAHEMKSPKANDEGLENRKNCHFFTQNPRCALQLLSEQN